MSIIINQDVIFDESRNFQNTIVNPSLASNEENRLIGEEVET